MPRERKLPVSTEVAPAVTADEPWPMEPAWGGRDGLSGRVPAPVYDRGESDEVLAQRRQPELITKPMVEAKMAELGLYDMQRFDNKMDYMVAFSLATKAVQDELIAARKGASKDRFTSTVSMLDARRRCDRCGQAPEEGFLAGEPNGAAMLCRGCHPYPGAFDLGRRVE